MGSGPRSIRLAAGTLATVPLAHALLYLRNQRLSGVLELRVRDGRRARIACWRGRIAQVVTTPNVAPFGAVAYELDFIDAQTLDETMSSSAARERPQAEVLLERGFIDATQRDYVIGEQLRRRVHHLFTFPKSTMFTFHEGSVSTFEPSTVIDSIAPVWRGISDFPSDHAIADVLHRIGDSTLRLVNPDALEHAVFSRDEKELCDVLAGGPMTLRELRATTNLPALRVDSLVYLLVLARAVEGDATGAIHGSGTMWAPATSTAPDSAPRLAAAAAAPAPMSPVALGVEAIRVRAENLKAESSHEALGIETDASPEAVRAAYFRLARMWNPLKLSPELECVRDEVERIFTHMTLAYRALTDHSMRSGRTR